jgi:hypothetical protein
MVSPRGAQLHPVMSNRKRFVDMTGICARLALAAGLLAAAAAAAQVGPPIRLAPPGAQAPPPAGIQSAPLPAEPAPAAAPRPTPKPADPVDAAEPGETVFGPAQWDGSARSVSLALLQRLPNAIASPTLHGLARRLLSAAATAPAGDGDEAAFLALRLEKLTALGESSAIAALLARLPAQDPAALQARLDGFWLDGKSKEACALTKEQLARTPTTAWQMSQVACAALAGDRDGVAFGMQLLDEQQFDDPTFAALVEMAGGAKTAGLPKQPSFGPVSLGLARDMKGGLPPDVLRSTDGSVLRAVAGSRDTQPILRLAAAERAANAGALPAADLVRLYRELETSPAERADPLATARADDGPRGRALLYLAIQAEPSPGQRAELLRTALDAAMKSGTFALAARLYEPPLAKLVAAPELVRMALPVGQALYLVGDDAPAKEWYLRARESAGPDGGGAATRLWALGRLASGDEFAPLDAGALAGWYELQQRREPAAAAGRLALFYALIEGLGDAVPGPAWEPLVSGKAKLPASNVDPLLAAQMRSAAESGRVGETVLLVLDAIGARLPGPDSVLTAYDCLVALRFAGLDREARDLAIEIAVAAGL